MSSKPTHSPGSATSRAVHIKDVAQLKKELPQLWATILTLKESLKEGKPAVAVIHVAFPFNTPGKAAFMAFQKWINEAMKKCLPSTCGILMRLHEDNPSLIEVEYVVATDAAMLDKLADDLVADGEELVASGGGQAKA